MVYKVNINYDDIIAKEQLVINYGAKFSDFFTVLVIIKRPYSQNPPVFNYDNLLNPFITKYIFEKHDWLVSFLGQLKHQIMIVCRCCKECRKALEEMPNLFLSPENNVPEDICFYRGGKPWFATITHEKMAFMMTATKDDLNFLQQNKIGYHIEFN